MVVDLSEDILPFIIVTKFRDDPIKWFDLESEHIWPPARLPVAVGHMIRPVFSHGRIKVRMSW